MEQFNIGDIVKLKTGSPNMTVVRFENPDRYISLGPQRPKSQSRDDKNLIVCSWFEGGTLKENSFPALALERV